MYINNNYYDDTDHIIIFNAHWHQIAIHIHTILIGTGVLIYIYHICKKAINAFNILTYLSVTKVNYTLI